MVLATADGRRGAPLIRSVLAACNEGWINWVVKHDTNSLVVLQNECGGYRGTVKYRKREDATK